MDTTYTYAYEFVTEQDACDFAEQLIRTGIASAREGTRVETNEADGARLWGLWRVAHPAARGVQARSLQAPAHRGGLA